MPSAQGLANQIAMKLLVPLCLLLSLASFPAAVISCSCVEGAFQRSRRQAIKEDFCGEYTVDVYLATVTKATCNCLAISGDADLYCSSYAFLDTATVSVSSETTGRVVCERVRELGDSFGLYNCSAIVSQLVGGGSFSVIDTTTVLPGVQNTTQPDGTCRFACPFNDTYEYSQPCMYTVHLDMVYKGAIEVGENLTVPGPDVLTSCGYYGRVLELGKQYVVGIGGPCSPVSEWDELGEFTQKEVQYLSDLAEAYTAQPEVACRAGGMMATPLSLLILSAIALLTAAILE